MILHAPLHGADGFTGGLRPDSSGLCAHKPAWFPFGQEEIVGSGMALAAAGTRAVYFRSDASSRRVDAMAASDVRTPEHPRVFANVPVHGGGTIVASRPVSTGHAHEVLRHTRTAWVPLKTFE